MLSLCDFYFVEMTLNNPNTFSSNAENVGVIFFLNKTSFYEHFTRSHKHSYNPKKVVTLCSSKRLKIIRILAFCPDLSNLVNLG